MHCAELQEEELCALEAIYADDCDIDREERSVKVGGYCVQPTPLGIIWKFQLM